MEQKNQTVMGQPVFHLQTMLRTISFYDSVIPRINPTGIFDEPTLEAVMILQREFHPPVTGIVNQSTWEAVVTLYRRALTALAVPFPSPGYPFGSQTIQIGDHSIQLLVIQAMFNALAPVLEGVEEGAVDGVHRGASVRNVRWLQSCEGCSPSGVIAQEDWNTLSRLYNLFVSYAQSPNLTRAQVITSTGQNQ